MDYHIYIHNQNEGGGESPTKPKPKPKPKPTKPKPKPKGNGIGWMAVAVTAAKCADKAFTTYDSFASAATGDYRYGMAYSNAKAAFGMAINPLSAISVLQSEHMTAIQNKKAELQRELLGDSMISERTKKV